MRRLLALAVVSTIAFGCTPPEAVKPSKPTTPSSSSSGSTSAAAPVPGKDAVKLVALHVPKMSCPHNCWPEVKKTLEGQEGVASVQLAKQEKEDEINDRTVYVSLKGDFNANAAIAALDKIGFDGTEIVK